MPWLRHYYVRFTWISQVNADNPLQHTAAHWRAGKHALAESLNCEIDLGLHWFYVSFSILFSKSLVQKAEALTPRQMGKTRNPKLLRLDKAPWGWAYSLSTRAIPGWNCCYWWAKSGHFVSVVIINYEYGQLLIVRVILHHISKYAWSWLWIFCRADCKI